MKLVAIINAWGDTIELLPHCINNIKPVVDSVFVIWSLKSNYGEVDDSIQVFAQNFKDKKVTFFQCEPNLALPAMANERDKRNFGLKMAKNLGYTHFLMMDSDEFYEHEPFLRDKQRILRENLNGIVCASQVYFKSPRLSIGLDTTRVTFISTINVDTCFTWNKSFPFSWEGNQIRIDPTRQLNYKERIAWSDIICHHYSYIRKDLKQKIRNSTARPYLEKSSILNDFIQAKAGYFCQFYQKTLVPATVDFGIPEL